jgi:hypothetical protein
VPPLATVVAPNFVECDAVQPTPEPLGTSQFLENPEHFQNALLHNILRQIFLHREPEHVFAEAHPYRLSQAILTFLVTKLRLLD